MITVFVKEGFRHVWMPYLEDWAGDLAERIDIRTYEELRTMKEIDAGAVIFSDIERLTSSDRCLAQNIVDIIRARRPGMPILNDPSRARRRYALLRELFDRGMNPFNVYRLTDTTRPARFPVFLRYENDHTGATTDLLFNQRELDRGIVRARIRGHDLRDLLIVEFTDTKDAKRQFMKYGAVRVADTVLARHAYTSYDWVVKAEGSLNADGDIDREFAYVSQNPRVDEIRAIFQVGNIEYGRLDYALLDDAIVVWEINTNPFIIVRRAEQTPASLPRQEVFIPNLNAAFRDLSCNVTDLAPIEISEVTSDCAPDVSGRRGSVLAFIGVFVRAHKSLFEPVVRIVEFLSIPFEQTILAMWKRTSVSIDRKVSSAD